MKKKLLPYTKHHIGFDDVNSLVEALFEPAITRGEKVRAFENKLASDVGAKHCVSFNSGSSALAASYFAAQSDAQTHVVTTPNTFIATISPALQSKSCVHFVDIDSKGRIDLQQAQKKLEELPGKKIFVPMHYAGHPLLLDQIDYNRDQTFVIEDAAHALGSRYSCGNKVGSCLYSDVTIFSFHPAKIITTAEGGAVTTNSDAIAAKLRLFRNNGIVRSGPWDYDVLAATGNYHMSDLQAALGLSQMDQVEAFIGKRRELAALYQKLLPEMEWICSDYTNSAWHLNVAKIDFADLGFSRQGLQKWLLDKKIGTQVHYKPLYKLSAVLGKSLPGCESFYEKCLSLPLYYDLKESDVEYIAEQLKEGMEQLTKQPVS